jgi:hypothetical protein
LKPVEKAMRSHLKYCQKAFIVYLYNILKQISGIKFGPMEMAPVCQFFASSQKSQHPQLEPDVSTQKIRYDF